MYQITKTMVKLWWIVTWGTLCVPCPPSLVERWVGGCGDGPHWSWVGCLGASTEGLRHTIINAECLINYLNRIAIPTMFNAFARVSSLSLFPAIAAAATVPLLFNNPTQCTGGHQMWNTSTLLRKQNTHFYKTSVFYEAQHDVHQALNDVIGKNLELKKIVTMQARYGRPS